MSNILPFNSSPDELQVFNFNGLELRGKLIDDEPMFVLSDVVKALGLTTAARVAERLREKGVSKTHIPTGGGNQLMTVIDEGNLYRVIMRSNSPVAEPFESWVADEVLPAIRKTGSYNAQLELPKSYSEALRELATTVEAKERLELENKTLKPKAKELDEFMGARGTFSAEQAAKLLCRSGINTGQNRLLKYMDSIGWTSKANRFAPRRAVQRFVEQRLIDVQATKYKHPKTGEIVVGDPKIVITPKGLHKLRELMLPPMDIELLEVA